VQALRSKDPVDVPEKNEDSSGDKPVSIGAGQVAELFALPTVSMAVLEMDLVNAPFIVFRNAATDTLSVVYRHPDGYAGWIDPSRSAKSALGATAG